MKRPRTGQERAVSPPPTKKKVESSTTGKVVANFFKRASQKEPNKLRWRIIHETLMVGSYDAERNNDGDHTRSVKRRKVAAFDFDSTLIKTSSGNTFGRSAEDWQWWHSVVPVKLRELYSKGYQIVIISNQAGIALKTGSKKTNLKSGGDGKRLADFKAKVGYVLAQLDLPISVYAATERDGYRKPRVGMWTQMIEDYGLGEIELEESLFVGDAAGRIDQSGGIKADHSCSDRDFAANIGILFHTPEECFLGEVARPFQRSIEPTALIQVDRQASSGELIPTELPFQVIHNLEVILLCGSPGSGKSTFYEKIIKPLGYERVNQDILKSRDKCLKVAANHLSAQKSVVVDNTNADADTRKHWIDLAKKLSIPIRAFHLSTPPAICRHNDAVRAAHNSKLFAQQTNKSSKALVINGEVKDLMDDLSTAFNSEHRTILPPVAFTSFHSRFMEPRVEEGFSEVIKIPFVFRGSEEAKAVWTRYWL